MVCISKDEIKEWLKKNLDDERYEHSIGTAETAFELASEFGLDSERAYLAGLVHDCAKCLPKVDMLKIMEGLDIDECEMINPKTYHAPVGAYLAKKEFGINDEEILSSIRWHTLGKLKMTDFEKVVFIADKIEPKTRPSEYINKIRPRLFEDNGLDMALLECYKGTIKSLAERELKICMSTIDIYNELIKRYERN